MTPAAASHRAYFAVFAALMVLLWATYETARHDFGVLNFPLTMLIASTKAVLIAAVFMDLRRSVPLTRLASTAGLFWLTILFALTAADYWTR
jgi:cytochrome c oxidase subunit 4